MKHPRHFERASAAREALQIGELIADLDRIVRILNSDIAAEEEQAQVFERTRQEYPIFARTLAARRDDLTGTIAALERRLAAIYRARLDEVSA
jgi:ABC-type transporter Mla subunit MlaD